MYKVTTRPERTSGGIPQNILNIKRIRKRPEGRQVALEQTLHRNKGNRKRSLEKTEIDIKVLLLRGYVDTSIEDTCSMFRSAPKGEGVAGLQSLAQTPQNRN
jgi:hypothetical protein